MGLRKSCAGSSAPAVLLAIVILILVGSTVYFHVAKTWWFPAAITPVGHQIDQQFFVTFILTGIVFVLAQLGLALVIFAYLSFAYRLLPRSRPGAAQTSRPLSWSTTTVRYRCPLRWLISSIPIRVSPASRSRPSAASAATRAQIPPTVRHAIRISCETAVFEQLTASHAT